jgi:hypothetical protein
MLLSYCNILLHEATGLDGCAEFVAMARALCPAATMLHQVARLRQATARACLILDQIRLY